MWTLQGLTGQAPQWRERRPFGTSFPEDVDRLIVAGDCPPVVVPMPDAWTAYGGSQFIDSTGTGRYATYLCDELVPFVDERFATVPSASGRAVQGKSSGGYGALVLAMLRPDVWGALGDVAGDAGFEYAYLPEFPATWAMLREHGGVEAFWTWMLEQSRPSPAAMSAINTIAMSACYSPGPDGRPELPFSLADGALRDDVWARWLAWDPVRMLPAHLDALRGLRGISLECGLQDEYNLYVGTAMLHRGLEEAGIPHRFELFPGGHGGIGHRYAPLVAWLAGRLG